MIGPHSCYHTTFGYCDTLRTFDASQWLDALHHADQLLAINQRNPWLFC
jgi:hypothetical protein